MEPAQICDILKGIILVVCCTIMTYIDTSMMYHLVRGQSTIKLYVFFNMLDVSMLTWVEVFTIIPECFKILRLTFYSQLGPKKKMSCFRLPYRPSYFWAYSNFFEDFRDIKVYF